MADCAIGSVLVFFMRYLPFFTLFFGGGDVWVGPFFRVGRG